MSSDNGELPKPIERVRGNLINHDHKAHCAYPMHACTCGGALPVALLFEGDHGVGELLLTEPLQIEDAPACEDYSAPQSFDDAAAKALRRAREVNLHEMQRARRALQDAEHTIALKSEIIATANRAIAEIDAALAKLAP